MKQVKMFFSGLVAVALLGVAVAMAAEPQSEIGSGGDSTSRDIDVWVPFDLGLWDAPQGSVHGGHRGSRGLTFRGSRRGGAGGGNLTGLLNSRRLREALELTDEQAEQLRKINVDTRKITIQKRADRLDLIQQGVPQIVFANLMVASTMLNTLWLYLCGGLHYGEVAFDIAEALMRPIRLPVPTAQ